MNYQKIYNQIIEKRKLEEPEGYVEVHHIVPRSLGGTDEQENLVKLTAREHFICHALLLKIQPIGSTSYYKMLRAFIMMSCCADKNQKRYTGRVYAELKIEWSKLQSSSMIGSKNSQYGKVRCVPIDALDCKKHEGYFPHQIPEGWITTKEWKIKNKIGINKRPDGRRGLSYCNLDVKERADDLYKSFKDSGLSLRQFSKSDLCEISQPALTNLFKKYIIEYQDTPKQLSPVKAPDR